MPEPYAFLCFISYLFYLYRMHYLYLLGGYQVCGAMRRILEIRHTSVPALNCF